MVPLSRTAKLTFLFIQATSKCSTRSTEPYSLRSQVRAVLSRRSAEIGRSVNVTIPAQKVLATARAKHCWYDSYARRLGYSRYTSRQRRHGRIQRELYPGSFDVDYAV